MDNLHDIEKDVKALVQYPDYNNSIANLACSILKYYGIEPVNNTLKAADEYLKTKHKNEYKRYFELEKSGVNTDLDAVETIYIAYLCANMEAIPNVMSYEEFLQNMKNGRNRVWQAFKDLKSDEKN